MSFAEIPLKARFFAEGIIFFFEGLEDIEDDESFDLMLDGLFLGSACRVDEGSFVTDGMLSFLTFSSYIDMREGTRLTDEPVVEE